MPDTNFAEPFSQDPHLSGTRRFDYADDLPLLPARFLEPRGLVWGSLAAPDGAGGGTNEIAGGLIFFGGGVPLYNNGKIIGGLGISGDTSCTDHEIAKRARDAGGLNPPGGKLADDIQYTKADKASVFTHPLCLNTFRNGMKIGDEAAATGY